MYADNLLQPNLMSDAYLGFEIMIVPTSRRRCILSSWNRGQTQATLRQSRGSDSLEPWLASLNSWTPLGDGQGMQRHCHRIPPHCSGLLIEWLCWKMRNLQVAILQWIVLYQIFTCYRHHITDKRLSWMMWISRLEGCVMNAAKLNAKADILLRGGTGK